MFILAIIVYGVERTKAPTSFAVIVFSSESLLLFQAVPTYLHSYVRTYNPHFSLSGWVGVFQSVTPLVNDVECTYLSTYLPT